MAGQVPRTAGHCEPERLLFVLLRVINSLKGSVAVLWSLVVFWFIVAALYLLEGGDGCFEQGSGRVGFFFSFADWFRANLR